MPRILVGIVTAPTAAFNVAERVEGRRLRDALCVVAQLPRAAESVAVGVFVGAAGIADALIAEAKRPSVG
jgi:hypothetical protein